MFAPLLLFISGVVLSGAQTDFKDLPNFQPKEITLPECNEPNEVLNHCVQPCGGEDSCYDRYQKVCPAVIQPCIPLCVCKEGFIRKTVGRECIPKEECGAPCEDATSYTDCKQCSNDTCSSIVNPSKPNCQNDVTCTPGCTCWPGFYKKDEDSPCLHQCLCSEMEDSPDCEWWKTLIE